MNWLPLHLRRQVHLSSYMFKIIKGQGPSKFINKFSYISWGSRDGNLTVICTLLSPKI